MINDSYVEIDTSIIRDNIKKIIKKYNDYDYYIGVIKGYCYGHGSKLVKYLRNSGLNYLAVSTLEEALQIRELTDLPILCMQKIELNDLKLAEDNDITITVSSYDYYQELIKGNLNLKVHLKIDTGMNRLGLTDKEEIKEIYDNLINNSKIKLEGIFTHMQTIGSLDTRWQTQINNFKELTSLIDLDKIKIVHIYNTNGVCYHSKSPFCTGIRFGILMYGVCPRKTTYSGLKGFFRKIKHNRIRRKLNIEPILEDVELDVKTAFTLKSRIIEIKDVKKDEYVGYGLKYKVQENSKIAVIPIGYADGIPLTHTLSFVYINGQKYQIVGSINMKMITVLVDENVKVNDEVEIINKDNIRGFCSHNHITPHYLFTTIPSSITRIYKESR